MITATLSWPEASIYVALIVAVAVVISVLIWSIFRTGQTAITSDSHKHEPKSNRHVSAREA